MAPAFIERSLYGEDRHKTNIQTIIGTSKNEAGKGIECDGGGVFAKRVTWRVHSAKVRFE